jgi:hypothetical protein
MGERVSLQRTVRALRVPYVVIEAVGFNGQTIGPANTRPNNRLSPIHSFEYKEDPLIR